MTVTRAILSLLVVSTWMLTACASSADKSVPSTSAAATPGTDLRAQALAQLGELASAATTYETNVGRCPTSVDELVNPPSGGALIPGIPNDPWGTPVAYMPAGPENPQSAFVSAGPDKELLTSDDLSAPVTCMGGR